MTSRNMRYGFPISEEMDETLGMFQNKMQEEVLSAISAVMYRMRDKVESEFRMFAQDFEEGGYTVGDMSSEAENFAVEEVMRPVLDNFELGVY